ncbi:SigE family RNA polymerase sigma factor [Nocardioides speluncae]|uniref:SigE family RNA polymerase sigma factor n=1 Tax=Nocardioides speluncae TaxID=2670337 RepID=UPI000D697829|nr:SigE family RNA polymerase sigma factor [Nocardioides speluncae]
MSNREFVEFYAANKDRCLRAVLASGVRSVEAEDAVAEAFARAWASWRKVRALKHPSAWVVRTAVNANISWWRKRRREVVWDRPPDSATTDGEPPSDLVAAVRRLPRRQREVVVLRYLLDLNTAATADWLGIAPGTVTAHLHHALATLRTHLVETEGTNR